MSDPAPGSKHARRLKYLLMLAFLFVASYSILNSNIIPHDHEIEQTEQGQRELFPNLEMMDEQGLTAQVSDFKGKVVLVSFWATWCKPCLDELPLFADLARAHPEELVVLAVNQDDDPDVKPLIDEIWSRYKISFKTYYDPERQLGRAVNLEVLPTNFVLDRAGRIAFSSHGLFNWKGENAKKLLTELFAEKEF